MQTALHRSAPCILSRVHIVAVSRWIAGIGPAAVYMTRCSRSCWFLLLQPWHHTGSCSMPKTSITTAPNGTKYVNGRTARILDLWACL